jgi:alkylated DNA repair dioxygenase AlkB
MVQDMSEFYQGSLLDVGEVPALAALEPTRTTLSRGAWVDFVPRWVTGSDDLFLRLQTEVPWRAEQRQMYERVVEVPRLLSFYGAHDPLPDPLLDQMRDRLSRHYAAELGEPFVTAGLCHYRDGDDSVAWHGDRIGRSRESDTMVAIVSVGALAAGESSRASRWVTGTSS